MYGRRKDGKQDRILIFPSVFVETFFLIDFHKNNVISDLADTVPGDDIFTFTAEQTAESSGAREDQGSETAGLAVKFDIYGTAQTAAGTGVDDFFLP